MNRLALICGNSIPFVDASIMIHNPTLSEIGSIGEDSFWMGCEILRFDKENLTTKDKVGLEKLSNFDIIMSMVKDQRIESQIARAHLIKLFMVLFPDYQMQIRKDRIAFFKEDNSEQEHHINRENFPKFMELLTEMFCLGEGDEGNSYNPSGDLAAKIADKLKERKAKLASQKQEGNKEINILERYVSILSIGLRIPKTHYKNYTVYQIFDEYQRFKLREAYEVHIKASMVGAKDLPEIEDWTKDLYS